jgi:hypothetical protein
MSSACSFRFVELVTLTSIVQIEQTGYCGRAGTTGLISKLFSKVLMFLKSMVRMKNVSKVGVTSIRGAGFD